MREIIKRLMENHLEERSYRNIKYKEGDEDNIRQSILILANNISDTSKDLIEYLKSNKESDLSDTEIVSMLQDLRSSIHSIGRINTPERYHKH